MFAITGLMYGSQYFQGPDAPLYRKGLSTMIGVVSAGAALVIVQEIIYWHWNKKLRAQNALELDETKHIHLYEM